MAAIILQLLYSSLCAWTRKSREPKEIVREIERLVDDGVKEVMLLGQNVNSYGNTFEEPFSFAQLLREIEKN